MENIDLQKKLDILTDENSVYINKTTDITVNDEEMIGEIIGQIENILQRDLNEEDTIKMVIKNKQLYNYDKSRQDAKLSAQLRH